MVVDSTAVFPHARAESDNSGMHVQTQALGMDSPSSNSKDVEARMPITGVDATDSRDLQCSQSASDGERRAESAGAYPVGARVLYINGATGTEVSAVIKAVHYDDPVERYYTVTLDAGGNERQTPGTRLRPYDSCGRSSSSSNDGGSGSSSNSSSATDGNKNEGGDGRSEVLVASHPEAPASTSDERALSHQPALCQQPPSDAFEVAKTHGDGEGNVDSFGDGDDDELEEARRYRAYIRSEAKQLRTLFQRDQERIKQIQAGKVREQAARIQTQAAMERAVTAVLTATVKRPVSRLPASIESEIEALPAPIESEIEALPSSIESKIEADLSANANAPTGLNPSEVSGSMARLKNPRASTTLSETGSYVSTRPDNHKTAAPPPSVRRRHGRKPPEAKSAVPALSLAQPLQQAPASSDQQGSLPTWRVARERVLVQQRKEWSQPAAVGEELRAAVDVEAVRIAEERRQLLGRLEKPLRSFLEMLFSGEDVEELGFRMSRSSISSLEAMASFPGIKELAMTLNLETISRAKRRLHIEATLTTGILSARRAMALAKIDQLVVTEDAQLIAAAEAEAADAKSLAASLKKQHEEHQVDKGRDEICRSMLDGLQRSSAHVVDMLAKVAGDGQMTASNLHQVLQALGFKGVTHEDAVAVFAWLDETGSGAIHRSDIDASILKSIRRMQEVEGDADLEFRAQAAEYSSLQLQSEVDAMKVQPGPLRKALFALTERWHDYLATDLALGARLIGHGSHGPTWRDTLNFARWMLLNRFTDDASGGRYTVLAKEHVEEILAHAQRYAWRALYPELKSMEHSEWRLYWVRVSRTFATFFTNGSHKTWAELAASDARTMAVLQGKSAAQQFAAAAQGVRRTAPRRDTPKQPLLVAGFESLACE